MQDYITFVTSVYYALTCAVARGSNIKSFRIHLFSSYFLCVTQTKTLNCMSPYWGTGSNFPHEILSTKFSALFWKNTLGKQILNCFFMLPQTKFWYFQKKIIKGLDPLKPLSFVGELHSFFFIKVGFLEFLVLIKML